MSSFNTVQHQFTDSLPETLDRNIIYVSLNHNVSIHLCRCGCDSEIVLPIRPDSWRLTYDGESISLSPSIGNWRLPCRSHYWIVRNRVQWAPRFPEHSPRTQLTLWERVLAFVRRWRR